MQAGHKGGGMGEGLPTLPITMLGSYSLSTVAALAYSGASCLQWPHHGA